MKHQTLLLASFLAAAGLNAAVLPIQLSPAGTSAATGLSPANEIPAATGTGSGDTIFTGISFDTDSGILQISVGYGSYAGFTDLTGPAIAAHLHGPAGVSETAPPIHDFVAAMQHLAAPNPAEGGVIIGAVTLTEEESAELLAGRYYINIHTEENRGGEIRGQLIYQAGSSPELVCPEPVEAECESHDGTPVELIATVSDADGDALTVTWTVDGNELQVDEVPAGAGETQVTFNGLFGYGMHEIQISVSDGVSDPVECSTQVNIVDTMAPTVKRITTFPRLLWPPNHKMVPVRVRLQAMDDCSEVRSRITGVRSNEPLNDKGDGNTDVDWEITGPLSLNLRAERSGRGNGRIYTVTVESRDAAGNSTISNVEVHVPHDMGGGRVPTMPDPHRKDGKPEVKNGNSSGGPAPENYNTAVLPKANSRR